ncbi:MAG: RICIN domain-containing protein [Verrucomicrobiota bacterium]
MKQKLNPNSEAGQRVAATPSSQKGVGDAPLPVGSLDCPGSKKHSKFNIQHPASNRVSSRKFHQAFGVEVWISILFVWLFAIAVPTRAQDHTIFYSTTDAGVTRSITNWGLDTCWPSFDNMQRGLIFMGTNNVNIVRVGFTVDSPLTNNDVSPADKTNLQICANYANMATAATKWDMNELDGVNSWYQSGSGTVNPDRWAAAIEACQRFYKKNIWSVEGFNEPDYSPWGEGSRQNLYDIFGCLQASTNFPGAAMAGGSTLNDDNAVSWFNAVSPRATIGTTHCLAGSVSSYVNFLQTVAASNALPFNPEVHNVCEAIIGAEYGLNGAIWWGTAELARGNFVKACQGTRLGYADDWANWTAAAVYRGTNGAVQAFVGASERMAATTSYRFFSKDRDVFYDGYGPQRDYTVTIPGGSGYMTADQRNAEMVVNITWGADVQPPIGGRYIVVNRNSGKVLGVPGSSTNWGATLTQNTYTNGNNQLWDVYRLAATNGGDFSYYTLTAVHSGATADESNFSYNDGNAIIQYGTGGNAVEHWFFEYAGNSYFYIRSRWSGKYLDVSGASVNNGASIVQWTGLNRNSQQWRLIPAGAAVEFVAPAAPTGVTASANAVSVQLNWKTNRESDLASYTVLRGTNSGGPYEICARGLTNNAFTDKSANQAKTYYYVIKAVDRSLNTSGNSAQAGATPSCGPTLLARYSFDGNTSDSSGNANHATATGSPTFVAGKHGSALNLNGTDQYAMIPAGILASVTNFTIAAWVYWNGGDAWQRILDFGNDTTQYLFLTPGSGSGTLRFAITTNGGGAEQILETFPLPVGQWRHVAVTRSGNTARLYTNGVLAVSGTVTIAPASFNPVLNNLGASQYAADPLFSGRLDDLYIYNYALSDTEVARLAANQPPPPTTPTVVSAAVSGKTLILSWPSNYVGSRLLMQTNHFTNGISLNTNDWGTVPGSQQTNQVSLPIDPTLSLEFYRLIYP